MPAENVVKLAPYLEQVGEAYRFDPDVVLEEAKGQGFHNIVIIGDLGGGETWVSSAANAGEALVLIERAKHRVVFGE